MATGSDEKNVLNKVKFGVKLETELVKNDIRSDNQSEKVMKLLSDDTDEQSGELYNSRFKQLCNENNSDDGVYDNSQISNELMKYLGIDNDSETKAFLEKNQQLISLQSYEKLIELVINKEMSDVICSLI
ncbi:unnamed protein product [Adineta steineri]|uniref:Uncharacterized protein n=1 Tax=Adineta steineri TaxID=433720 RepID=A0A815X0K5_9BILA|nr:unnamed protein product [Adineta steineri]CAF1547735.1 unnamed protein product [Adineta steineri]